MIHTIIIVNTSMTRLNAAVLNLYFQFNQHVQLQPIFEIVFVESHGSHQSEKVLVKKDRELPEIKSF